MERTSSSQLQRNAREDGINARLMKGTGGRERKGTRARAPANRLSGPMTQRVAAVAWISGPCVRLHILFLRMNERIWSFEMGEKERGRAERAEPP